MSAPLVKRMEAADQEIVRLRVSLSQALLSHCLPAAGLDATIAANVRKLERELKREWQSAYDSWLRDMTRENRIEAELREEAWLEIKGLLEP